MSKERTIVFSDGSKGLEGDFPVGVIYTQEFKAASGDTAITEVVDPIFSDAVTNNLYGRVMTLLEATVETSRLKAVKDIFGKELNAWSGEVYRSAREIANGADSSENVYTRRSRLYSTSTNQ